MLTPPTTMAKKHLRTLASTASAIQSGIYAVSRLFSTGTASSSPPPKDLYSRILPFGNPRVSIVPLLDQWAREGRPVEHHDFRVIIKQLRKFKRFTHALEVSEWMGTNKYFDPLPGDFAVRLDLISKVHGLERSKTYFNGIPFDSRTIEVYSALLNCYAYAKDVEKAEEVMQKIRKMDGPVKTLSYNVMLKLYSYMGEHKKVEYLVQEIEEKGIDQDTFTCNIRLNSYALASDFDAMEKLLMKMEADPVVSVTWRSYAVTAHSYIRAGFVKKATATLKKLEHLARGEERRFAYELLLTSYASMGSEEEVHRIWNLYKKIGRVYNRTYLSMISSLMRLDDLDGAQKIYEEWEAQNNMFDFRIPNFLVKAYCKKGLMEKAESFVDRLIESGKESAVIWQHLAAGYCEENQKEKRVEAFKKAILASHPGWKPSIVILDSCLEYLKGEGRIEAANELVGLLQEKCTLTNEVFKSVLKSTLCLDSTPKTTDLIGRDTQVLETESSSEELVKI